MATTNYVNLRHRWADKAYRGRFPIRGTCTGGSTTTVVDSGAAMSGARSSSFDHCWIKITTSTDGAAPQGEIRQVSEGGYTASTGTFTVQSAFTAAPAAGDTYEIHYFTHPDAFDRMAQETLRNVWVPRPFPLGVHIVTGDDNDMEVDSTAGWVEVGTGSLAKSTSVYEAGRRGLTFTPLVAEEYMTPASALNIQTELQYATAVSLLMAQGTARLTVWDNTQSEAIQSSGEADHLDWQTIHVDWTPEAGSLTVMPRFIATTGHAFTIDDYHTWVVGGYEYAMPSWISMKQQVLNVVGYPQGNSIADRVYANRQRDPVDLFWEVTTEDWAGANEVRVYVEVPAGYRPYIIAANPITAPSADYVTTTANTLPLTDQQLDIVVKGVEAEFMETAALRLTGKEREVALATALQRKYEFRRRLAKAGIGEPTSKYVSRRESVRIR